MAFDARKNFAYSAVAVAPSPANTGTTLTVTAGDGGKFPATPFNATIWPVGILPAAGTAEIVRVTSVTGDGMVIARQQEGTTAIVVVAGMQIAQTVSNKTLTDIEGALTANTTTFGALLPYASGGDDFAAMQAVITANPGVPIIGRAGQAYQISAPLVQSSGQTLDVTRSTSITQIVGTHKPMVLNTAVAPLRTVTDGAATIRSNIVTSATAAFTSADIGRPISLAGAGPVFPVGGFSAPLYGTILTVNSATSVTIVKRLLDNPTVAVNAAVTVSGQTLSVYGRDSAIAVVGGNCLWIPEPKWDAVSNQNHVFGHRRVDGLIFRDIRMQGSGMVEGSGGYYGVAPGDVTGCLIENCGGTGMGNPVQPLGPFDGIIRRTTGKSQDDLVAAFGYTGGGPTLGDTTGDIHVMVEDTRPSGAYTAVKLASGPGTKLTGTILNTEGSTESGGIKLGTMWEGANPDMQVDVVNASLRTAKDDFGTITPFPVVSIDNAPNSRFSLTNINYPKELVFPVQGVVALDPILGVGGKINMNNMRGPTIVDVESPGVYRISGPDVQIDLGLVLNPTDGDQVVNTNAALQCGVGRVIYNLAARSWKNLYTGAIYTPPQQWPPKGGDWVSAGLGTKGYILFGWSNAAGFYAVGTGDVVSLPAGVTRTVTGANGVNVLLGAEANITPPVLNALATATTGGSLPAATAYFVVMTALNAGGETIKSNEQTITTGAGATNTITASCPAVKGATSYRAYIGTASTVESSYFAQTPVLGAAPSIVLTAPAGTAGTPPGANTTSPPSNALRNAAGTQGSQAYLNGAPGAIMAVTFNWDASHSFKGIVAAYSWDGVGNMLELLSDGTTDFVVGNGGGSNGPSNDGQWNRWWKNIPPSGSLTLTTSSFLGVASSENLGAVFFD